jgi:ATP-dependent Clp endopeptidase proteolytic subunit ClpP
LTRAREYQICGHVVKRTQPRRGMREVNGIDAGLNSDETEFAHPTGFEGQASDIEIHAREAIALKRRMEEIIAQHTGQPLEKVSKDMERDYFMTAEEAKEYGIIDNVIAHRFE